MWHGYYAVPRQITVVDNGTLRTSFSFLNAKALAKHEAGTS
jgi:hypothetical protein